MKAASLRRALVITDNLQKLREGAPWIRKRATVLPPSAANSQEQFGGEVADVQFLHPPPDCGDRDRHPYGDRWWMVSTSTLPTLQFPNIVPPEILVTATYPGADAKTLTQAVATPIEQQMNGVDNMIYMDSVSANNGVMQLFVGFDVKTNPDIDQVWHNCA